MSGVEVNAANYYLPVQDSNGDIPPCKERRESTSQPRRTGRRILRRRHDLTPTSVNPLVIAGRTYAFTPISLKYLEIAISVGPVSTVQIVLGDDRGDQLVLHTATWGELMVKREDILQLLHGTKTSSSPLWIHDLAVERCTMNDTNLLKLSLSGNHLYLQPATVEYLFTLEQWIDLTCSWLFENMHTVNTKFQNFVNVLREKNIIETCQAAEAIRESSDYNGSSTIDCELFTYALDDIIYEAVNK